MTSNSNPANADDTNPFNPTWGTPPSSQPPTSTPALVTTRTEETRNINGVEIIHRRTTTVPADQIASEYSDNHATETTPTGSSSSPGNQTTMANWFPRIRSTISGAGSRLSAMASNIVSTLHLGGGGGTIAKERWTVKIHTNYENDKDEQVEDSMELEFGSKAAAEKYAEQWKQEMMASGSKNIPYSLIISKSVSGDVQTDT